MIYECCVIIKCYLSINTGIEDLIVSKLTTSCFNFCRELASTTIAILVMLAVVDAGKLINSLRDAHEKLNTIGKSNDVKNV